MPKTLRLPPGPPEIVYHYTTMDAMIKIANDGSIWATSVLYLNDLSEQEFYLKLVREYLPEYRRLHPEDGSIVCNIETPGPVDFTQRPFVASFSYEGDSLSQWRSYCAGGNGGRLDSTKSTCHRHQRFEQNMTSGQAKQCHGLFAQMLSISAHSTARRLRTRCHSSSAIWTKCLPKKCRHGARLCAKLSNWRPASRTTLPSVTSGSFGSRRKARLVRPILFNSERFDRL